MSQHAPQVTWPGVSLSGGVLCPGGFCPGFGGLCTGLGDLCPGWGVSVQGRGSLSRVGEGLCPGWWRVSVQGGEGVSVQDGGGPLSRVGSLSRGGEGSTPSLYGNERAVRILLECILVWIFWLHLMTIICDLKIYPIASEPNHFNFFFALQPLTIGQLFKFYDILTQGSHFFYPSNSPIFPCLFPDFLRVFPDFFLVFTKIF